MSRLNILRTHRALGFLAVLLILLPAVSLAQSSEGPMIYLQYASFDPLQSEPAIPSVQLQSIPIQGETTYLLQFIGPVQEGWKEAVQQAGAKLYGYVPDFAFIARMDGEARAQVSALPFVRWVGPFHPAYRLAPTLQNDQLNSAGSANLEVEVMVEALPDADLDGLAQRVQEMGGSVKGRARNEFAGYLRLLMPQDRLGELAALDGVLWVEPYFQPVLYNDIASGTIMRASEIRASLGLYGSGQIVGVADSGLDVGTTGAAMSNDFEGRIVDGRSMCSSGSGYRTTWNDPVGHGTHVSGSVLGSGTYSGGQFAGVAPQAQIVFQSVDGDPDEAGLECVPDDLVSGLFDPAYSLGARVHTNSWGGPTGGSTNPYGGYTSYSQQVDQAAWNHKDLLILFAAGNSGVDKNRDGQVDLDSLGSPGTAKNAITVGATENNRPSIDVTWGDGWLPNFPSNPIRDDRIANNAGGMAAFSSRGPADDGRMKPDLVAPGTFIISARSHDPGFDPDDDAWGEYDANYVYMGGTSMSTPLTAGAATLVREWLIKVKNLVNPSAALIKALLINGAEDISPGQYTSPQEVPNYRPNPVSGWGRVNLVESINPAAPRRVWFKDNTSGLRTGGVVTYTLTIGSAGAQIDSWENPKIHPTKSPTSSENGEAVSRLTEKGYTIDFASDGQLIVNGGFESEGGWTTNHTERTNIKSYQGDWSMASISGMDGEFYQTVTMPADLVSAELDFYWMNETPDWFFDVLQVCVGDYVTADYIGCSSYYSDYEENWNHLILDFSEIIDEVRGQTFDVVFMIDQDDILPDAVFYIDNVTLNVVTSGVTTPAPTATTPPPTPTASTPAPTQPPPVTPSPTAVLAKGGPFRITLVWTDYPGSTSASRTQVNDLDLEVIAPDGRHYYGNGGAYPLGSPCLRAGKWDQCNNVEGVIIPTAYYGTYTVIVHGYNIPHGPQPFALAASGDYLVEGSAPTNKFIYLPLVLKK